MFRGRQLLLYFQMSIKMQSFLDSYHFQTLWTYSRLIKKSNKFSYLLKKKNECNAIVQKPEWELVFCIFYLRDFSYLQGEVDNASPAPLSFSFISTLEICTI